MAGSARGEDKANPAGAVIGYPRGQDELSCLLGIARYLRHISQLIHLIYPLLPLFFFARLWTSSSAQSLKR